MLDVTLRGLFAAGEGEPVIMPPLAERNLFHDKVRLAVTVTGIVFSVVLIVVQLGLFVGFTTATSNLLDHSGADLWITSKNVPYVETGSAIQRAQAEPGTCGRRRGRRTEDHRPLDAMEAA